ncbi:DUF2996 domain-containing protein [Lusitaniella coriacea]|uniref:DUF2996 domain-containing protein n=1 Tax=Lusitaniella coriacea TaxID=1983105 RepID=UPI003CED6ECE
MAEETKPQKSDTAAKAKKAKAKKEKPPALEDKPFTEFIKQHFIPSLEKAFAEEGIDDMDLQFAKEPIPIEGAPQNDPCWQVKGSWEDDLFQFNLYFPDENIKGQKGFSFSTNGAKPSILESFMIDERKVSLGLMVLYTLQRLNGEKLLTRN